MPDRHGGSPGGPEGADLLSILVDGSEIPEGARVLEACVTREIGALPEARVVLRYASDDAMSPDGNDGFPPGAAIEIAVVRFGAPVSLFRGVLTGKSMSLDRAGSRLLTLVCRHPLYVATLAPNVRLWHDSSDADCIVQVLAQYGQVVHVRSSGTVHQVLWQCEASDWDFVRARAEANGWWLLAGDDGVELRVPDEAQVPAFELEAGISIHAFEGRWDVCDQPLGVQALAWDSLAQDMVAMAATEPAALPGRRPGAMLAAIHGQSLEQRYAGDIGAQALQTLASAALQARRRGSPSGRIRCIGTPHAMPGAWMGLRGLGSDFDGDVPVSGVTQTVDADGWITEVRFGTPVDSEQRIEPAPRHDPWHGLQIGIVEALEDPRGEDRVRVRLVLAGGDAIGVYARLAKPDAGPDRGMVFLPEIGDEVVLACPAGNPAHAVILGSLHSSARPSPLAPRDDNPLKGYVSRSGMKLSFDDAARTMRLDTPAGRSLLLSDGDAALRIEDPHGNRIVMDADGIAIESAGKLSLRTVGDLRLQGMGVDVEASAALDLSAGAAATLETNGVLSLRGSLLKLN